MLDDKKFLHESEKCALKGVCAINPTLSHFSEIILLYVKELSYYLLKLKDFGIQNEKAKEIIISALASMFVDAEYNQVELNKALFNLDALINQSKIIYKKYCNENDLQPEFLKSYFKHSTQSNLIDTIKKGEKYFVKKNAMLEQGQKNLLDIIFILLKSVSIKMIEIERLGKDPNKTFFDTLQMINQLNFTTFSNEDVQESILKYIEDYYDITKDVFYSQVEIYGTPNPVEVSFSTRPGKAILVSGTDFKKLEAILEASKNLDIDVYTHGLAMMMAHAFPEFQKYKNLRGHFGMDLDTCVTDFAAFPGPILMTMISLEKIDYLYRGRLFTIDPFAPRGVVKLTLDDVEPIIKAALDSKGFSKETIKPSTTVWFDQNQIKNMVKNVVNKMLEGKINHLYIIGLSNQTHHHNQYFEKFFSILPDKSYAISLSCDKSGENIFHLNALYDYAMIYRDIIKEIKQLCPLKDLNITLYLTKCDRYTVANLLYLKRIGLKEIFTSKCPPTLFNPSLMDSLKETFGIKNMTTPEEDIHFKD